MSARCLICAEAARPVSIRHRPAAANAPPLWSAGGDTKPIAVRIYQIALPTGEPLFIHGNSKLRGYSVDVVDIEMNQRVTPSIALVFRQVEPHAPTYHGDEQRKAGLELVLPFLDESEPSVPHDRACRVLDVEQGHDLLVHCQTVNTTSLRAPLSSAG